MATVWVAVTTVTLCSVFAVVLALGQAVAARHRAGGAADLAALAAAGQALRGAAAACGTARRVAGAQDTQVVRCVVRGEVADVTVRAGFGPYRPAVRSRAGPAGPTELPTGPVGALAGTGGWPARAADGPLAPVGPGGSADAETVAREPPVASQTPP
ncbi:helicase [Streptomyces sp. NBC_00654]|uniref:Rv3654c family TadE-like protein n=1 Tax=Streptomyces sp. NBC_00654 TaxID=2975799 RepID=UPI00224E8990|nr:Rv3654c family TadE-like protein [Streptomyces sp. NBC_00654]MCX4963811.1 helicase [Streptomyces sp. NBC_00654]